MPGLIDLHVHLAFSLTPAATVQQFTFKPADYAVRSLGNAEKDKIAGYFSDITRPKAQTIGPQIHGTVARACKADVNIAFGTDQGVAPYGDNAKEFE